MRACSTVAVGMAFAITTSATEPAWTPVPLVSEEIKADPTVQLGGEGAQWPQALAISSAEPPVILYGTDVGGVFRSMDGGETFAPANVGLHARGATDFAFDPNNPNRVLLVACNSLAVPQHGLYLSTDAGASWNHVFSAHVGGYRDLREQLVFDPSSHDAALGYSTEAYWARLEHEDRPNGNPEVHPAIYRSLDGGKTWNELSGTTDFGGGFLAIHPAQRGVLYAANERGLFRSDDRGESWVQLDDAHYTSVSTHPDRPDSVWVTTARNIRRSDDRGTNWTVLPTVGLSPLGTEDGHPAGSTMVNGARVSYHDIKVSPADPNHLSLATDPGPYAWNLHTSRDGGQTWANAEFDDRLAFLPTNRRQPIAAWHPRNPNELWSTGMVGDWVGRSDNTGATFVWAADGINGILLGGTVRFNQADPDLLFAGSQDYNGAVTRDGGATWTYVNPSGNAWGGFTYGGYALDNDTFFVGNAGSWGGTRVLKVSHDGGDTWLSHPETAWNKDPAAAQALGVAYGHDAALGYPGNSSIGFAAGSRTDDGGHHWTAMEGCVAVYAATSEPPYALFGVGIDGRTIVCSEDTGRTWTELADLPETINDLAVTPDGSRLYIAFGGRLGVLNPEQPETLTLPVTPPDQFGNRHIASVAIDPQQPTVVYAAQRMNIYKADTSAIRSTDGGTTWSVLNVNTPLNGIDRDGGRESIRVQVHPSTREAWFVTSCYGIWKATPPTTLQDPAARSYGKAESVALGDKPLDQLIRNGGIELGNHAPSHWTLGWIGSGSVKLQRLAHDLDESSYALVADLEPNTQATVSQTFFGSGRVTVNGMVRTDGSSIASIGIKSLPEEGWEPLDAIQVHYAPTEQAWMRFEAEVELHPDSDRQHFELYVESSNTPGRVWLDAVSITPVGD
ncbi:MAG: hypothetical protein AAF916_05105 [Planctomycetota bacterium]